MRVTAKVLLNQLIATAEKTQNTVYSEQVGDIRVISPIMKFQMVNLAEWCKLLGKKYKKEDWNGNEQCGSNWDIIYFEYKGVLFFELVEKENEDEIN